MEDEIIWMKQEEFWKKFDTFYAPNKRFLDCYGYFNCELDLLKSIAKQAPVYTPPEEEFAGPVERWYCEISGNLVLLTYYYTEQNQIRLVYEGTNLRSKISEAFEKLHITIEYYSN